ncbi:MAG: tRNA (adenosine(37)-N6)-threonylcarbamoyltransferase complex transferase subunit TsaD [Pseudomonadota bacterium]
MLVLGIESSCDETAAAVLDGDVLLSSKVATQEEVHAPYGGVVPELASRRHLEVISPVIQSALKEAKVSIDDIEGIAVTKAPGLVVALLVGLSMAKGLAFAKGIPIVGVNHLEGHLGAVFLEYKDLEFPWIGLVVSGGHTSLYLVKEFGSYELLGATCDDAAGEAFDKVAKLLGLGYPGGPLIQKRAQSGNPDRFKFTKPKLSSGDYDFSFSGIKTACLVKNKEALSNNMRDEKFVDDLAASFQKTAVRFLTDNLFAVAHKFKAKGVAISGGVAANALLRSEVERLSKEEEFNCYMPRLSYCTDNAAMIAYVGSRYLKQGKRDGLDLNATANEEIC